MPTAPAPVGSIVTVHGLEWRVIEHARAWDCIGQDSRDFRVAGGRMVWTDCDYICRRFKGNRPRLARLGEYRPEWGHTSRGLTPHRCYVDAETVLEFLEPVDGPKPVHPMGGPE